MAETIRYLFRKAESAPEDFGETRDALSKRLPSEQLPEIYFELARVLRRAWEERVAEGSEARPFGKAMLDQCQAWHRAFRANPSGRDDALAGLLRERGAGAAGAAGAAPPIIIATAAAPVGAEE